MQVTGADNPPMNTENTSKGFDALPLSAAMQANLQQLDWTQMTAIQAASLPITLSGRDVIAQASTGSGKTVAFALPLVHRLQDDASGAVQALVLCPTRELADQVAQSVRLVARARPNTKVITLCGGVPLRGQLQSLAYGADVVVGTPGRIQDHLDRGSLSLDAVQCAVLDEADRMLDMGFVDDIAAVLGQCPADRQTLLFSATYPDGIAALAKRFMREPQMVQVASQHSADKIRQLMIEVGERERLHAVGQVLAHFQPSSSLAFCNTKQQCRDLVAVLQAEGVQALALYGDLDQRERDQVLIQFANRSCSVLVATDVAARGLDVSDIDAVINVDVTPDPEVHVHRVGRTGRADAQGLAVSLVSMDEMGYVGKIETMQGRESEWMALDALTPAAGGVPLPPMLTLQLAGGRKEKIRPGDVMGALGAEAGLTREQVGKININDFATYVAVAREHAAHALRKLNAGKIKGKKVKARYLADADGS